MLFIFSALFLIFSIILVVRKGFHLSTLFLFGIIVSWTSSVLFLNIYLNTINYYYYIQRLFGLPKNISLFIHYMGIDSITSLRLLSISVVAFSYFLLTFAISYVNPSNKAFPSKYYIYLALPLLFLIIYYDNSFYVYLYGLYPNILTSSTMHHIEAAVNIFNIIIRVGYLFTSMALLIRYFFKYSHIRFLRNKTLSLILSLLPMTVIYTLIFSWLPRRMIKPMLITGYFNYLRPQIRQYMILFNWLPHLIFLSMALIVFSVYKFNSVESSHKYDTNHINKSIDIATLGIKAFTHSVKNNLVAIQSEINYVESQIDNNEELAYSLSLIRSSIDNTYGTIEKANHMLKKISLDLKPLQIKDFLYDMLENNASLIKHIKIKTNIADDQSKSYLDPYYMNEVFSNLLHNAVDALNSQENTNPEIIISSKALEDMIVIQLEDNGPGIEEENLKTIFLPFSSTKNPSNNWGIGLSYCYKIVTAHDGNISVSSIYGSKTIFEIVLPIIRY